MPADFNQLHYQLPKYSAWGYRTLMHNLETALGFGASEKAKFKLHCLEFFTKHGWIAFHDAFPQVSRATLYRWRHCFKASGQQLKALVPLSTRPHHLRTMVVPASVLSFLKAVRRQHPHLSKYKLKPFLDAFCLKEDLPLYSASWIGKVLSRHQLFFGQRQRVIKRRRQARSGYTIRHTPNPAKTPLGYLELDGVKVYWCGRKLLFLTAIELKTRTAWVKLVPTLSSYQAKVFLAEIIPTLTYPLTFIHTDNGSEFHAVFDAAVVSLKLTHVWSPPRSPKIHSHIERFNGTFQGEFIDYYVDLAVMEPDQFQLKLENWLAWYNQERPHHALGLKSPHQYLLHLQQSSDCLKCP
jgi:transposase InsO family protein